MINKKQASLILRVKKPELSYFVQVRDNVLNAKFKFPGYLSLFGGEVEEGESGRDGFLREMSEELSGLDFSKTNLEERVYNWRASLKQVDEKINLCLNGNFGILRGFQYNEYIPDEALGNDRGKRITYQELFDSLEQDHYFVGETSIKEIKKIKVQEGKRGVLIPADLCSCAFFYPTDKIAIMHDIVSVMGK